MSRNNDVYQVLVTKGNLAVLPAAQAIDTLAPGQVGVFDSETNLSIDGSGNVGEFYIAVGVDRDNDGTIEDIVSSAGQVIQKQNIRAYSFRPHTAQAPMIIEISDYKTNCDTDYGVKLEFRNQLIYRRQGYVPFTKTYVVRTACCEDCADCTSKGCNELTKLLVNEINLDEDGFVTAKALTTSALTILTHGTSVDYAEGDEISNADLDALVVFNQAQETEATKVCTKVEITTVPMKVRQFCEINTQYFNPRSTIVIASLVEGFNCTGKVTETQEAAFEEGNGYDIKQLEYNAGGWNGKPGPYRQSTVVGLAMPGFEYFADANEKYDQFALTYDQFSVGGWQEYLNNLATVIAVPATSTVTRNSLATILDTITGQTTNFDALADDAATANVDPAVVEKTEDGDSFDTDGIA